MGGSQIGGFFLVMEFHRGGLPINGATLSSLYVYCNMYAEVKKSRIRETPNLSTDVVRSTTYFGISSLSLSLSLSSSSSSSPSPLSGQLRSKTVNYGQKR